MSDPIAQESDAAFENFELHYGNLSKDVHGSS